MSHVTKDELLAAAFPQAGRVQVRETHLSFVVLTGDIAYKVKKALRLDFIDTTSLQRRRQLCEEELRINRRFAPEIYLEVVPIAVIGGRLRFEADGVPIEYAVKMRQFDAKEELQSLLGGSALSATDLAALGERIALIHENAEVLRDATPRGTESFARKVRENFETLVAHAFLINAQSRVRELVRWSETSLEGRMNDMISRERDGFIRECHGDLHTGNIVRWDGQLTAFDAIEFDKELRFIDVLNDVAFLWMDLIAKNQTELAFSFLNRYLERTGDYGGLSVLPSYSVYRALVRAKVELISFAQHEDDPSHGDDARVFLSCAENLADKHQPLLIVMHGASGSGKSWLSGRLAPVLPAVRIRSDLERKRLAGIEHKDLFDKAPQEIYSIEFNERTYARLLECARGALRGAISVIVDAAFLRSHERLSFASLAKEEGATFAIVSCESDPQTLRSRIAQRNAAKNDPSDADEAVMLRQLQTMESFSPAEEGFLVRVDTRSPDAVLRTLQRVRRRQSA